MPKFYLSLLVILLAQSSYSATKPVHLEGGNIPPRGKLQINVNPNHWAGYHNITCDMVDPSHSSIIKITPEYPVNEDYITINDPLSGHPLPAQLSLSRETNQLKIFHHQGVQASSFYYTIENLDDDVTISVKNCEVSPDSSLSENYWYLPTEITCVDGVCNLEGEAKDYWTVTPNGSGVSGKFKFGQVTQGDSYVHALYFGPTFLSLDNSKAVQYYQPVLDNTGWYQSGTGGEYVCLQQSTIRCPFYLLVDTPTQIKE